MAPSFVHITNNCFQWLYINQLDTGADDDSFEVCGSYMCRSAKR